MINNSDTQIENESVPDNKVNTTLINGSVLDVLVGAVLFAVLFAWSVVQPITSQPDELTRYMIPYYIFTNWKLPNGNLEELLVRGYGISYGFFPCLPYICMAPLMKLVSLFTDSSYCVLMGARLVNIIAGVVSYVFVRKTSKKVFSDEAVAWLFTLAVCFWPQVLFIFSYTNCDAFAFMSVSIMCYAMCCGIKESFDRGTLITLSIGISICLLSYFNAYGCVLACAIVFILTFVGEDGKFDIKNCMKKGLTVVCLVLVLSGWWFIRNAILYNGDFIGMTANRICSEQNAADYLKPSVRDTIKNNGGSIFDLLKDSSYLFLLKQSFFGRFGNMELPAPNYIIRFFKCLMAICFAGLFVPNKKRIFIGFKRICFDIFMGLAFVIPVFLCFYYSYADDYQPQGRYMLPGLMPLMCLLFMGVENIRAFGNRLTGRTAEKYRLAVRIICICCIVYIAFTTAGCVYLIMKTYLPGISDTFALVYTGNLYE